MVITHIILHKGKRTRSLFRRSVLMNKVLDLRSRSNSVDVTQLAEAAFNNLKVSNSCVVILVQ